MRKLVVTTFTTLDGVMQAPGGPGEDRDGGFEHGGWSVGYWDERMGELALEIHLAAGAVLFGRKTYEILGGHWPRVGDDDPMAAKLNAVPKHVASRTLHRSNGRTRRCSRATCRTPSDASRPRTAIRCS
jgi:dihydrofolate reductase